MPIDLSTQRALSLKEAAAHFPPTKEGKRTHVSRVLRHITIGTKLPDGSTEVLSALRFGSQWVTTLEAIQEYGERVAAARIARSIQTPAPSTPARRKERERTAGALDALGIK